MNVKKVQFSSSHLFEEIYRSLKETGFAVLSGAPISSSLIQGSYEEWKEFFASEEKHGYLHQDQHGYFPFRSENAKDQYQADPKEFFHLYPGESMPLHVKTQYGRALFELLRYLGQSLLAGIDGFYCVERGSVLGLAQMASDSSNTLLRALHYPPNPEREVRAAAHEDINLLTLLPVSTAPGLQVLDKEGKWHDVGGDHGDIVINAGDMLQYVTDGFIRSTTHRVMTPAGFENQSRYSMAVFVHAKPDTKIAGGKTAQEFLDERLKAIGIK